MLCWMCGKTRRDMIRHDNIREIIGVASTVKKKKKKRCWKLDLGYLGM